ncbi:MAG: periplasmic heavy metal sensor [Pseudomonadota bacterium]
MIATRLIAVIVSLTPIPNLALAQDHSQPYAGQETRSIKSLSDADIQELRQGGGWGLALPAELNGKPGPAHLLEHSAELELSAEQIAAIEKMFADMRQEAISTGERLIAAEAALSTAFEGDGPDAGQLAELVQAAEAARSELRLVHLSRHLATPSILTREQIDKYQVLRGYAEDPCDVVPEGHDATMWKEHNGCG